MKNIVVDAAQIDASDQPVQALAALYGLSISDYESLIHSLCMIEEPTCTFVINWQDGKAAWVRMADLLESVQQHSSQFFLIWGTRDAMVNVHARSEKDLLEPFTAESLPSHS